MKLIIIGHVFHLARFKIKGFLNWEVAFLVQTAPTQSLYEAAYCVCKKLFCCCLLSLSLSLSLFASGLNKVTLCFD